MSLSTTARGNWGEALATAWLIEAGYEVFAAVGGRNSCDLVALKAGVLHRVEVKVGTPSPTSRKPWTCSGVDPSKFDLLLIVLPDGQVLVDPPESLVNRAPARPRTGQ